VSDYYNGSKYLVEGFLASNPIKDLDKRSYLVGLATGVALCELDEEIASSVASTTMMSLADGAVDSMLSTEFVVRTAQEMAQIVEDHDD